VIKEHFLGRAGHLRVGVSERKDAARSTGKGPAMNATMKKFGYPETLVVEFDHWAVLVRANQVTLGSLVLAASGDATAYSQLPEAAFAEQSKAVGAIERALKQFVDYERINYLMLMMVDPHVHFHVIPRYEGSRDWNGHTFRDTGWPGPPRLETGIALRHDDQHKLTSELAGIFR
jgi:diadenosine tetraphosphate (Ap4A) HIT family hydrolase